jgi:hypothetical protein
LIEEDSDDDILGEEEESVLIYNKRVSVVHPDEENGLENLGEGDGEEVSLRNIYCDVENKLQMASQNAKYSSHEEEDTLNGPMSVQKCDN